MSKKIKALIVEDELSIRKFIAINLSRNEFEVEEAECGEQALEKVETFKPLVVVLDVMMPGIDGFEVCKRIRDKNKDIIIIMLTAKGQDMDKIMGLDIGADDYMVKPFNPLELMARIRAIVRRSKGILENDNLTIKYADLLIDLKSQRFFKNSTQLDLTPTEFSLIKLFLKNPGKAFNRDEILNKIWGEDYFGDTKTVDVHIRRLREKIEDIPSTPKYIETVWGVGYRLKEEI
ncbi:response regulator transcription factor [Clostridium cylindrosporum]|uniref:Stage 0 sporulation protein A homolog n=1 Tax=Clostridium cylindrosporum DSM 605 TaxID=1121307 RepID=A0A0J8DA08_CLOCY|nr:response regulator transcription factor [Clostridium cylindrosporum]KMT21133.1 alkaline phosphatase synthesis transcriptional regulatory protein PhoP [Clostridium cylindrosporum DSM 605]